MGGAASWKEVLESELEHFTLVSTGTAIMHFPGQMIFRPILDRPAPTFVAGMADVDKIRDKMTSMRDKEDLRDANEAIAALLRKVLWLYIWRP